MPTEVLAFYAAAVTLGPQVAWVYFRLPLFALSVCLVPLVLFLDGRATGIRAPAPQFVLRTLTFMTFATTIGCPDGPGELVAVQWISGLAVIIVPLAGAWLFARS
ncbi:MAG: hypothetical protein KF773_07040 [Deltaproteobacteria bacterium]|nr:hypothetical protein [Deltaproteobacteria bacterium]